MSLTTSSRYAKSTAMLDKVEKRIPLASQTFSKSRVQFPIGAAPLFLTHGQGARTWDVDGNEYVDLVMGLLPMVLGYCDPDVDAAVRGQLERGIVFSLASELEYELAQRLGEIIPCAEMVRYGKNGSDATSAAVRLARAVTGRDRIAAGGYHGWQDWYIGATTRDKGVPKAVAELTRKFAYNDIDSIDALFREHPGEYAAVILEPAGGGEPAPGYLEELKELTHKNGALLIFDEIVTGFRFHIGGAQSKYGVTPDLACFGKSMGNGMPISCVVGKEKYMKEMEEIFFSSTFGGEALSLAASCAVIDKMRREPVIDTLWATGARLNEAASAAIAANGLEDVISIGGTDCWRLLGFRESAGVEKDVIKTFFCKKMLERSILINASMNVCYALTDADVTQVTDAWDEVLPLIKAELDAGTMAENLGCPVARPVFQVRQQP